MMMKRFGAVLLGVAVAGALASCSLLEPKQDASTSSQDMNSPTQVATTPSQDATTPTQAATTPSQAAATTPSQAATASSQARDYRGLSEEWQGTWCSAVTASKCINLADLLAQWPDATLHISDNGDDSPLLLQICELGDPCTEADSTYFSYFPVGLGWDCPSEAQLYNKTSCDPDYTSYHDITKPRLKIDPNHEQNAQYVDSEPLYLDPTATGTYDDTTIILYG